MPVAAIDTTVLLEYRRENGQKHDRAQEIVNSIDDGTLPTARVTDHVLLETLNWLHSRKRHDLAVDTFQRLNDSAGFEVVYAAQKDFTRATDLFTAYDVAFGDATIASYMEREGIEYLYTFDERDFGPFDWVTQLDTADNPFA
ncbi:MAG: PIN domain-containing protein [Halobacteriales archaeon]|nr:PIN domain-containing protein [Halobacteriales archaeon]